MMTFAKFFEASVPIFQLGQKVVTKCTDNAITGYDSQGHPMTGHIIKVIPKSRVNWYKIWPDQETQQRRLEGGCTPDAVKITWSVPEDQLQAVQE